MLPLLLVMLLSPPSSVEHQVTCPIPPVILTTKVSRVSTMDPLVVLMMAHLMT